MGREPMFSFDLTDRNGPYWAAFLSGYRKGDI
jgi:hypothetical protein